MAGPTKMIIITSDEDIIRQFSSNKTRNTRIIDLNDDEPTTSNGISAKNMMDLVELAQLSQPVCILF